LLSLQSGAGPPTHAPPEHASPVVHALPSLHETVLFVCTQPEPGSQLSSVHRLLSLQSGAGPPTQAPPEHASPVVQPFPSLHETVLFACTQPEPGSQLSSVHRLLSLQSVAGPGAHAPPEHVSFVVQAFPSLHGAPFALFAAGASLLFPDSTVPKASQAPVTT
jgi:hypothetical protein